MKPAPPKPIRFGDLGVRGAAGMILAGVTLIDLWVGGAWVWGMAALATLLMVWEYHRIVTGRGDLRAPALWILWVAGAGAVALTVAVGLWSAAVLLALGGAAVALVARSRALWLAPGLIYVGLAMCYLTVLRDSEVHGLPTVLWLVLVVISADVGAYFVGRMVGGPRLWPAVSPGKTWSGALGGQAVAVAVGVAFELVADREVAQIALLSFGVAVASQLGDLLESAVKRRFGTKDASSLIPGHGGVLDRLDGLIGGVWFFALQEFFFAGFAG